MNKEIQDEKTDAAIGGGISRSAGLGETSIAAAGDGTSRKLDRRTFITVTAVAGAAGLAVSACDRLVGGNGATGDGGGVYPGSSDGSESADVEALAADLKDNVYTRLFGVRPHIGAHEHLSSTGGSRMPPEVLEAMAEANRYFVEMGELHVAAGRRIADIMGAEDALISSGAFASMLVGGAHGIGRGPHEGAA